jgi:hypothetical protein
MRIAFVRRRLARAAGWLSFGAAIVPLFLYGVLANVGGGAALLSSIGEALDVWLAAIPLAAVSFLAGRDFVGSLGTLRREGDELVLGRPHGERRIPFSTVLGGIIVPGMRWATVELRLADGDMITARVADLPAAQALLRELRVDVANQRCRVQLADRAAALVVSLCTPFVPVLFAALYLEGLWTPLFLGAGHNLLWLLYLGLYAICAALLRSMIALPDVTVGTDGLAFRWGLRERFIPFADLADVRIGALGVKLVYQDGRTQTLRAIAGVSPSRFDALKLRIAEALAARNAAPRQGLEQLDRSGRAVPEWRAALAALARRGADYRAAGLSHEDLEALLVSPDASAERRLAAAVALSASKHPAAPERIRVAAAQCASERLRIALEKVSEGQEDDAAIAEALDEEEARHASAQAYLPGPG